MKFSKFYPSRWLSHEDGDKSPAVHRRGDSPRDAFHSEVDRLFDDLFTPFRSMSPQSLFNRVGGANVMLKPSLDLDVSDKAYTVAVELPGVDEKDISIEVNKSTLSISGEKKNEFEDKDEKGLRHMERSYGIFQRTLALPEDADIDAVKAGFDKGVLRVTIPRSEARDSKKVAITKE